MSSIALHIPAEHPAFEGHFPGNPLLPGVALLAEVIEAALAHAEWAELIGPRPRIGVAKFLTPVRPGALLNLQIQPKGARLQFDVWLGELHAATGHFEPAAPAPAA